MKRRTFLLFTTTAVMLAVAMLGMQKSKKSDLLLLDWASRGEKKAPPAAILIEFGVKDESPTDWSGRATISGAKVVHREGYRFRKEDKLNNPDGWKASSHRGLRVPRGRPLIVRREGIATVGVVLHLADAGKDAKLTIAPSGKERKPVSVPLQGVLAGKTASLWEGEARVRLITTATRLSEGKTEDDFPAACYAPDGTLWVAYIAYSLRDESRRVEAAQLKEQPKDFKKFFVPGFSDQLVVRYFRNGKWSQPAAITDAKQDLVRCAIAAEGNGDVWVVYSANRKGNHDIYARKLNLNTPEAVSHPKPKMGPEKRLTDHPGPDVGPVAATAAGGEVTVAYQSWQPGGGASINTVTCRKGTWATPRTVISNKGDDFWHPAVSGSLGSGVAVFADGYTAGSDYDCLGVDPSGKSLPAIASSRFEARPSICYDTRGRLWIAYAEGPRLWAKDYGALDAGKGNPIYNERSVRVVCIEDGKLKRPAAKLPTSAIQAPRIPFEAPKTQNFEKGQRFSGPHIGIDGKGRIWLTYREKFGTRYSTHAGSYWLSYARRLDGDHWSEPIEVHHADGLLDHRPVLLPHAAGGLVIVHNADGRYTLPMTVHNRVYVSYVDLGGEPVEPKLVPHEPEKKDPKLVEEAKKDVEAVKRIRDYRIEAGGKKYQVLRGEFHRHTEISWDGGADGSLEDMFRYAINSAALDWIGNTDHDNGAGREYSWWLTQKLTDAYHVPGRFTPVFAYERSVSYPHGHRNCIFAQRGVLTLPRLAQPDMKKKVAGIHADDAKMLYRYLRELGGICASHTSATSMGTDWRDHDPEVEPVVEIYQGDRMSYEQQGAPRAGYKADSGKQPINIAGWYPAGYVDQALAKGYKLGFQSSSDHWSTHISYCMALAEKHDRQSILDALRKRHSYGATDDIIVDVRCGQHIMGDELTVNSSPTLDIHIVGTDRLAGIDVIKDARVVQTFKPEGNEYKGQWKDPAPANGSHYYYIRVRQRDGELAWGSPLWIKVNP
jgi:Protein of unknown function (DUF3604)